jgi:hypothetical protein
MRLSPTLVLAALLALGACEKRSLPPSSMIVVSISPADGQTGVDTGSSVTVTFSNPVHEASAVDARGIFVVDSHNRILRGVYAVDAEVVTFTPSSGLDPDATYGVAVRDFVCDTSGNSLTHPRSAVFSTGSALGEIPGFPPFEIYPDPPDPDKISAWLLAGNVEVVGEDGAAEPNAHVNLLNLSTGTGPVSTPSDPAGAFTGTLPGGAVGHTIEVSVSDPSSGKTGPGVTVFVVIPPTWNQVNPMGVLPSARFGHAAVFDPTNARMVIFGGATDAAGLTASAEVFELLCGSPGAEIWADMTPAGTPPSARFGAAAVHDSMRNRLVLFSGKTGLSGLAADVWALSLGVRGGETWTPILPTGTAPSPRAFAAAVYDAANDRVIVFGGEDDGLLTQNRYSDVWALELGSAPRWVELDPEDPGGDVGGISLFPGRSGAGAVFHAAGSRMIAALGFGDLSGLPTPLTDSYGLSLPASGTPVWSLIAADAASSGRGYVSAVLDPVANRVLVYGGRTSSATVDGLLSLDLATDTWSEPAVPQGTPPPPLSDHSAVWDTVSARMLLFGGRDLYGLSVSGTVYTLK